MREVTRRSYVHEAQAPRRKIITTGRTSTEPHFRAVLCCRLGNHAFPKPIRVVVSCRLGNHAAFREPIIVVVSFETRTNSVPNEFLASCDQRPSLAFYFGFQGVFFQRASGARVDVARELVIIFVATKAYYASDFLIIVTKYLCLLHKPLEVTFAP